MNQALGDGYTLVSRHESYEEFRRSFEAMFGKPHFADNDDNADDDTRNCYAFVGNGPLLQPLWKNQKAFVMTENGATFANISYGPH